MALHGFVITMSHSDIRVNDSLDEGAFTFTPPPGSEQVGRFDMTRINSRPRSLEAAPKLARKEITGGIPARDSVLVSRASSWLSFGSGASGLSVLFLSAMVSP